MAGFVCIHPLLNKAGAEKEQFNKACMTHYLTFRAKLRAGTAQLQDGNAPRDPKPGHLTFTIVPT